MVGLALTEHRVNENKCKHRVQVSKIYSKKAVQDTNGNFVQRN